jgi:hypothetical protein
MREIHIAWRVLAGMVLGSLGAGLTMTLVGLWGAGEYWRDYWVANILLAVLAGTNGGLLVGLLFGGTITFHDE